VRDVWDVNIRLQEVGGVGVWNVQTMLAEWLALAERRQAWDGYFRGQAEAASVTLQRMVVDAIMRGRDVDKDEANGWALNCIGAAANTADHMLRLRDDRTAPGGILGPKKEGS